MLFQKSIFRNIFMIFSLIMLQCKSLRLRSSNRLLKSNLCLSSKNIVAENTYQYLDSGNFMRLEKFGNIIVQRSCPSAKWMKSKPDIWNQAHLIYEGTSGKTGQWTNTSLLQNLSENEINDWNTSIDGIKFILSKSDYGQIGVFPEQKENWNWITNRLNKITLNSDIETKTNESIKVLNCFAYTGGSTMASLRSNNVEVCL